MDKPIISSLLNTVCPHCHKSHQFYLTVDVKSVIPDVTAKVIPKWQLKPKQTRVPWSKLEHTLKNAASTKTP